MPAFKLLTIALAVVATAGTAAGAAPKKAAPAPAPAPQAILQAGAKAMIAPLVAQSNGKKATPQAQGRGNSQGANHASDNAIMKVCTHNNPSAQRSAICRPTVSPN